MEIKTAVSMFLIGLSGGFSHCIGMCHPFVLFISNKFSLPGYALLIPQIKYNLGRIVTYACLGFIAGFIGSADVISEHIVLRRGFTIAAGAVLILFAFYNTFGRMLPIPVLIKAEKFPVVNSAFAMGLILGFLPCGIVLAALVNSAVSTNAFYGALSMALFGLGTSIALMVLALFGGLAVRYLRVARWIFNAVLLLMGAYYIHKGMMM